MKNWIIRVFGLKGSWHWATRKMLEGCIVTTKSVTGTVKYRLSNDGCNRLEWDFNKDESKVKWTNANLFISDLRTTDWIIYKWKS